MADESQVKPTEEKAESQTQGADSPLPASSSTEGPQSEHTSGEGMYVKVYAPYKVYFEGEAQSVSAASETGPFDILKGHHNFITLLTACEIIVRTAKGEETIQVQGGIMHVKADSVVVFLDV